METLVARTVAGLAPIRVESRQGPRSEQAVGRLRSASCADLQSGRFAAGSAVGPESLASGLPCFGRNANDFDDARQHLPAGHDGRSKIDQAIAPAKCGQIEDIGQHDGRACGECIGVTAMWHEIELREGPKPRIEFGDGCGCDANHQGRALGRCRAQQATCISQWICCSNAKLDSAHALRLSQRRRRNSTGSSPAKARGARSLPWRRRFSRRCRQCPGAPSDKPW